MFSSIRLKKILGLIEDFKKHKPSLLKPMLFVFLSSFLTSSLLFLYVYIQRVTSADYIFNKALSILINSEKVNYKTDAKIFFSSNNNGEDTNLSQLEEYQNLKRSSSETYELKITGDIDRSVNPIKGNYDLSWSKPDEKIFGFDGYFQGYDLFYKVNYSYIDIVPESLKSDYSQIDLYDILSSAFLNNTSLDDLNSDFKDIRFKVVEKLPEDLLGNSRTDHYKVEMVFPDSLKEFTKNINLTDLDVWINKKDRHILMIKGMVELENLGMEGSGMSINFQVDLS